ncbi:Tryp_SPc [Nesidiocoris tenuis]|uniref:Tryp_SPc n=1 Tax=Nesidiocoris tenuis TaxID=355587 RepID=A0ABN7BE02_9HEMI|nr:Tryp_SPc [Nesidiocoris tenuis]
MAVQIPVKLLFLFGFAAFVSGKSDSKIISGGRARVIPHMVSLQKHKRHKCGGSLLTLSHVLLACHCYSKYDQFQKLVNDSDPGFYRVFAGHTDLKTKSEYRQTRKLESFLCHPKARWAEFDIPEFDLALVVTKSPFRASVNVKPIELYSMSKKPYEELVAKFPEDAWCWCAGWGRTGTIGVVGPSRYLNYIDMRIIPYSKCNATFVEADARFETINIEGIGMICAQGIFKYTSIYKGDSGGPLVCRGKLIGVASFAGRLHDAAMFAKVSEFVEWYGSIAKRSINSSGRSRRIGLVFLVMMNLVDIGML